MSYKLSHYLRKHRREWALTQQELATLLGFKRAQHVSRLERGERQATIAVAFALEIIFGTRPCEVFPKLFAEIEERTVRELYLLHEALADDERLASRRKRELAKAALDRAVSAPPTYDEQP